MRAARGSGGFWIGLRTEPLAASSRRSGPIGARVLEWKVRFFGVGAVLGLVGIFLEVGWLVTIALVVLLLAGLGLRFFTADAQEDEDSEA